jgi:hypothetical protein
MTHSQKTAHAMPTPSKLAAWSAHLNDEERVYAHGSPQHGHTRKLAAESIRLRRWAWRQYAAGRLSLYAVRVIVGDPPSGIFPPAA